MHKKRFHKISAISLLILFFFVLHTRTNDTSAFGKLMQYLTIWSPKNLFSKNIFFELILNRIPICEELIKIIYNAFLYSFRN
jgi:hypothetical protein